jgi:type II secretory pathway pseudopilin PulG
MNDEKMEPGEERGDMNRRPHGFSLLEVLLAMGILFGSLTVLSQLASIGIDHLNRAETATTAIRLCQNKLGEVLVGIQPLEKVAEETILENPDWNYSIEVQSLEPLPLSEVRVRVARLSDGQHKRAGRRGLYELVRWINRGEEFVAREGSPSDRNFQRPRPTDGL